MRLHLQNGEFMISGLSEVDLRALMHDFQAAKSGAVTRDIVFGPSSARFLLCIAEGMRSFNSELQGPGGSKAFLLPTTSQLFQQMETDFHAALERYFPALSSPEERGSDQYLRMRTCFFAPFTVIEDEV